MKVFVAGIIGGLVASAVVITLIILLPEPIEKAQELTKFPHPCQTLTLKYKEIISKMEVLKYSSKEDTMKFGMDNLEFMENAELEYQKLDCKNSGDEWHTPEFQKKLDDLYTR